MIALEANAARSSVTRLAYVEHQSQATRHVAVRPTQSVVLSGGGIGNAALLLQPRADGGAPVGNESGLVGKFLMEHPEFNQAGECVLDLELDRYWPSDNKGRGVHAIIVDDALAAERGLYGCSLQCTRKECGRSDGTVLHCRYGPPLLSLPDHPALRDAAIVSEPGIPHWRT